MLMPARGSLAGSSVCTTLALLGPAEEGPQGLLTLYVRSATSVLGRAGKALASSIEVPGCSIVAAFANPSQECKSRLCKCVAGSPRCGHCKFISNIRHVSKQATKATAFCRTKEERTVPA